LVYFKIMKISLFIRLFIALLLVGVVPNLFFYVSITSTYQPIIQKCSDYVESINPEIMSEMTAALKKINIQMALTLILIIVLVSFANILLSRKIVTPIKKLINITKDIAQGKLDKRSDIKGTDEIGELASSFNYMAGELERAQNTLKEITQVLEVKIQARTRAIEEEKKSLEEKVRQRTQEFQERVVELEEIHKLMVGRELKMMELKDEIRRLKEKITKN